MQGGDWDPGLITRTQAERNLEASWMILEFAWVNLGVMHNGSHLQLFLTLICIEGMRM